MGKKHKKQGTSWGAIALSYPPPPIVIDDSSWKNAAESFTVALTLTLGGVRKCNAPFLVSCLPSCITVRTLASYSPKTTFHKNPYLAFLTIFDISQKPLNDFFSWILWLRWRKGLTRQINLDKFSFQKVMCKRY